MTKKRYDKMSVEDQAYLAFLLQDNEHLEYLAKVMHERKAWIEAEMEKKWEEKKWHALAKTI